MISLRRALFGPTIYGFQIYTEESVQEFIVSCAWVTSEFTIGLAVMDMAIIIMDNRLIEVWMDGLMDMYARIHYANDM